MTPLPKLRVVFQSGIMMEYPNPRSHVCFSIGECDEWHPAKLISWLQLPTDSFAMFFETASCYRGEGFFSFITDQGQTGGEYIFDNVQPIRSMMVGVKKDGINAAELGSEDIDRGCWTSKILRSVRFIDGHLEMATNADTNRTHADEYTVEGGNGTAFAGGLSSNWSEALPSSSFPIESDAGVEDVKLTSSIASC